jgi:glutamyl-tRNA reductase
MIREEHVATPRPTTPRDLATVLCVGVSHRTASLALRERIALSPTTIAAILSRISCGGGAEPTRGVSELVILSTCNRLELYAAAGDGGERTLFDLIASATGIDEAALRAAPYTLTGADAVRHLCRTAAGLDSMVLGETQILGQIGEAYATALSHGAAGHALSTLFRGAARAGRRARAETAINRNPATASSMAVKLVSETVPDLATARVLVVGSGEMAELTLSALHYRGVRDVCVVNRTRDHAERLSERFAMRSMPFECLHSALAASDVVITSTSALHHIITREMVEAALVARPDRPMILVDIAVPRDVDPGVASLPGVQYVDLDDLQHHVKHSLAEREREVPRAAEIADEEATICIDALQQLEVEPVIADLRSRTDAIRRETLTRARRHLGNLSEADLARVEAFSESLINRLFHEPLTRLRTEARNGRGAGYAMAVRDLFGLTE